MPETDQTATVPVATAPPEPQAFDALYRDSRDDLFAYLTYLVGDRSLAEEITAQAFERAFRKRSLFKPGRGDLRGWLFSIARNAAVDELRRGGRESALELVPESVGAFSVDRASDDRLLVADAMRRLQARERELVALKFFAGLENAQIGRVLGISSSNVGTQLHRAISRLRAEIGSIENVL
ncbi:MAG: sigma-70 family RNA polymerase sigma factor [Thermoleophilaceae bacterium]|nr:sigma-70 family RNA polymerase sigma factor [Thermoleophilaceae bacterium]